MMFNLISINTVWAISVIHISSAKPINEDTCVVFPLQNISFRDLFNDYSVSGLVQVRLAYLFSYQKQNLTNLQSTLCHASVQEDYHEYVQTIEGCLFTLLIMNKFNGNRSQVKPTFETQ